LEKGDRVALIAPATVTYDRVDVDIATEALEALGLRVVPGRHLLDRFGYFAGTDQERADDFNRAFEDQTIRGVFALRGGWGASRMLPFVDFNLVAVQPKVLIGYSDITTLINAVYSQTGIVTFHGPNALSPWSEFSTQSMRSIVFEGKAPLMRNPVEKGDSLAVRNNRTQTIVPGRASGHLIGGNLTLFTGLLGTSYFPNPRGAIIVLEEVGEYIYRCDRMLSQLALAGVFDDAAGVVFGGFTDCNPSGGFGTFSLNDIFNQHIKPRNIPCFSGAAFGHVNSKHTIPIGSKAEIDADIGFIKMLESSVEY